MKKFLLSLVLLFTTIFTSTAHADYPDYLNGDRDYVLVDGHMGTGWYMKKSSLNVEQYAPPIYIISVSVYTVSNADRGNTSYSSVRTIRLRYDWDNRAMYVRTDDGGWRYLDPNAALAYTRVALPTGEMAFYVAYGKKFYGTCGGGFYTR